MGDRPGNTWRAIRLGAVMIGCGVMIGCQSAGSGVRWWVPTTWVSGSEAAAGDRARDRLSVAEAEALRTSQRSSHETVIALESAEPSRPVEVAVDSARMARDTIDQVIGPMTVEDLAGVRAMIEGLLSEEVGRRRAAEAERDRLRARDGERSEELARARDQVRTAEAKERAALARETSLANDYRALKARAWLLGGLATVVTIGMIYYRLTGGAAIQGLRGVGQALAEMGRGKNLLRPDEVIRSLDVHLDRGVQRVIGTERHKHEMD